MIKIDSIMDRKMKDLVNKNCLELENISDMVLEFTEKVILDMILANSDYKLSILNSVIGDLFIDFYKKNYNDDYIIFNVGKFEDKLASELLKIFEGSEMFNMEINQIITDLNFINQEVRFEVEIELKEPESTLRKYFDKK